MLQARLKESIKNHSIYWQKHALQRMMERDISRQEVLKAIESGIIIESYSDDYPFPSVLIAYIVDGKPLHAVVAYDDIKSETYVITAYIPDEKHFENDLITRKTI